MTKRLYMILLVLLTAITLMLVACEANAPLVEQFSVVYTAAEGGYIKGNEIQSVTFGEDSKTVTAVPFDGYRFAKWLDNDTTEPQRTELDVQNAVEAVAEFAKMEISIKYRPHVGAEYETRDDWAQNGGYVEGQMRQTIDYGSDATPVVAKPYAGFIFADWSDGSTNPERHDTNLTADLTIKARFVKTTQVFTYEYNGATDNNAEESIAITWNKLRETSFIVPQKDRYNFQGWFLDENLTRKAANHVGQSLMGNETLLNNEGKLFAKWISEDILVYPVLLIFMTETKATLTSNYKRSETNINDVYDFGIEYEIEVDYKMSEMERNVCGLIAPKFAEYLNEMLESIIAFEVDTYFTTETIEEKHLNHGSTATLKSLSINTYDNLEVAPYLNHYRTVMTTFGMGDNYNLLHSDGGSSGDKYSMLHMETIFSAFYITGVAIETLYDWLTVKANPQYTPQWEGLVGHYIHEFIHSVELLQDGVYDYHLIQNELEYDKQYLRNEYIVDGKPVGIPYLFWTGEGLDIPIVYVAEHKEHRGDMGTLISSDGRNDWFIENRIPFGSESLEITAIPNEGFRFVKWSDGVTTRTRKDYNVTSYLRVIAIFDKV